MAWGYLERLLCEWPRFQTLQRPSVSTGVRSGIKKYRPCNRRNHVVSGVAEFLPGAWRLWSLKPTHLENRVSLALSLHSLQRSRTFAPNSPQLTLFSQTGWMAEKRRTMQPYPQIFLRTFVTIPNMLFKLEKPTASRANTSARSDILTRGRVIKAFFCFIFAIGIAPGFAITVTAPANGAIVSSPFSLVAGTSTCASKAAVSMGYSIDHGATTIVTTSFSAMLQATTGPHVLHVKCWGKGTSDAVLLNITVAPATSPTTATPTFMPNAGEYATATPVMLSSATNGATIYYTTNGTAPSTASAIYSSAIPISSTTVVEAVAVAAGYTNSGLARADYVIEPATGGPQVPPNATVASNLQTLSTWHFYHDAGTPGTSVGETSLVSTPSLSGNARQFATSYTDAGGELYGLSYANDSTAMNFLLDGWVWIEAGSSIVNLEMDSNQAMANGETVAYVFQCSGYSKVWEYGAEGKWVNSSQACNPSAWETNTWHHVQIGYSRDDLGNVTYQSVWLDGTEQVINATVPSSFSAKWAPGALQTQIQMDGIGAVGSSTVYLDNLTIDRW